MSRFRLPVLAVLALVLAGLAYANGSFRLTADPEVTLGPRLSLEVRPLPHDLGGRARGRS